MKTKNISLILGVLAVMISTAGNAQQDVLVSKHLFNGGFYNPAFAGSHDYSTAGLILRQQWVGFTGAPKTAVLFGDVPFEKQNMGIAANLSYDVIGVTTRTEFNANYAYHIKISEDARLAFGIRAGMSQYKSNLSDLQVWNETDDEFSQNISGTVLPNFGFGTYYYAKHFYAGLSVPSILSYDPSQLLSVKNEKYPDLTRHYFLTSGVVIPLNDDFDLKPSAVVRYTKNAPLQADITMQALIKKMVFVGMSYRTLSGLVFMAEVQKVGNFRIGYAYDLPLIMMRRYSSGTHEVMLAYDFIKNEKDRATRFF